jgi:ATP-dependent RNA helicase DDX19/DBP5
MADLASRITNPSGEPPIEATEVLVDTADAAAAPQGDDAAKDQPEGVSETGLFESNYDVEVKLSDLQNDQESPLYSVSTFDQLGLSKEVNDGLLAMNYKKPSKIQEKALPLMLADPPRNMIAQSQSGTGKTGAFVLTLLSRIDLSKPTQPQALVLAPTRELARQIQSVIKSIGQFCKDLIVEAAVPGAVSRETGVKASAVVGTPGTVMDLIGRRQFDVSQLKLLIIDEADNMLDLQGMGEQCMRVRKYVHPTKSFLVCMRFCLRD